MPPACARSIPSVMPAAHAEVVGVDDRPSRRGRPAHGVSRPGPFETSHVPPLLAQHDEPLAHGRARSLSRSARSSTRQYARRLALQGLHRPERLLGVHVLDVDPRVVLERQVRPSRAPGTSPAHVLRTHARREVCVRPPLVDQQRVVEDEEHVHRQHRRDRPRERRDAAVPPEETPHAGAPGERDAAGIASAASRSSAKTPSTTGHTAMNAIVASSPTQSPSRRLRLRQESFRQSAHQHRDGGEHRQDVVDELRPAQREEHERDDGRDVEEHHARRLVFSPFPGTRQHPHERLGQPDRPRKHAEQHHREVRGVEDLVLPVRSEPRRSSAR